jgi:hypothetical protein
MPYVRIGWVNRYFSGPWSQIFVARSGAERDAQLKPGQVERLAVEVYEDVPDTVPQPSVALLTAGAVLTYDVGTNQYIATYPSGSAPRFDTVSNLIRNVLVVDSEIDAIQALPAATIAWGGG